MVGKMILLDWRSMKFYQIRALLLPVFILFSSYYFPLAIFPVSVFMFLSFSINPFAVEEKGELNHLYLTLPVSRKMIVTARYLLSLIMLAVGLGLSLCIMPLSNLFALSKWYLGVKEYGTILCLCCLMYSILNLFMFPVLFKLGYHKGKFIGFYFPAVVFAVIFSLYSVFVSLTPNNTWIFDFLKWATENLVVFNMIVILLALLLLLVSYALSLRVYNKRDF